MHIKNFENYRHYTDGRPIKWIKVEKTLLDDIEFHSLSGDAAKLLLMLWLLATEEGGELPDVKTIAFRFRTTEKSIEESLSELGHWIIDDVPECTDSYETVPNRCLDQIRLDKNRLEIDQIAREGADNLSLSCEEPEKQEESKQTKLPKTSKNDWKAKASSTFLFEALKMYPAHRRTYRPKEFQAIWDEAAKEEGGHDVLWNTVREHLRQAVTSEDWIKEGGKYVPSMENYIGKRKYRAPVKIAVDAFADIDEKQPF